METRQRDFAIYTLEALIIFISIALLIHLGEKDNLNVN